MKETEIKNRALFTDRYQLKMAAGFIEHGMNDTAFYEIMLRKLPENYSFYIVNGVEQAIDYVLHSKFLERHIRYLESIPDFTQNHIDSLRNLHFTGNIYAIEEGTPVGANTPILLFEAPRAEARLIETIELSSIKDAIGITTKANRIVRAARGLPVAEFGARDARSPNDALIAARAAFIGGFSATSNEEAGLELGIPVTGTMAHDWVMSFGVDREIDAFRAYYKSFPNGASFLIDTWNVIRGAKNAAIVAKEMERNGHKLISVRLDSGDIAQDSAKVRNILDQVGLKDVKIMATNELDEYKLPEIFAQGGKLDGVGVGKRIMKAEGADVDASFKMVEDSSGLQMKYSAGKSGIPGRKQVWRNINPENNQFIYDDLALWNEKLSGIPLLKLKVKGGKRVSNPRSLLETQAYCKDQVSRLPIEVLNNPEKYAYSSVFTKELDKQLHETVDRISYSIQTSNTNNLYAEEITRYERGGE